MKIFCNTLVFLFLLAAHTICAAQTLIKVNAKVKFNLKLKESHDFQKVSVFDTSGKTILEFINESVIRVDTIKKQIFFARFRQYPFGRYLTDTSVTDYSLKPLTLREKDRSGKLDHFITFDKTNATAKVLKDGSYTANTYSMPDGYFDDNMIETIVGYLPIMKGQKIQVNCFRLESNGLNTYEIEYLFDDLWGVTANNKLNCAVLHFKNQYSDGYIWIDKASHKNVKQIAKMNNASYIIVAI